MATLLTAQIMDAPTLGGTQFWTDQLIHGDWRIQHNVVFKNYRLLDDRNNCRAHGSFETCRSRLATLRSEGHVPSLTRTVVLTIHGLGRTRASMQTLNDFLEAWTGWSGVNMTYASTRAGIDEHAAALIKVLHHFEGVQRVHFVGHSMGNIVLRRMLYELRQKPSLADELPEVGHIVMLAPPNQGAAMARLLKDNPLFQWIAGTAGKQLGPEWRSVEQQLAIPTTPFAIIAGSTSNGSGINPKIKGDDDLIVGVDETKLAGAADFAVVPCVHTTIMDHPDVPPMVLNFLQHTRLHED